MREVNKLVRDNIPAIIRGKGETPRFHRIEDDEQYLQALFNKDEEEATELRENPCLDELADRYAVLDATTVALGFTKEQAAAATAQKIAERGVSRDGFFWNGSNN